MINIDTYGLNGGVLWMNMIDGIFHVDIHEVNPINIWGVP